MKLKKPTLRSVASDPATVQIGGHEALAPLVREARLAEDSDEAHRRQGRGLRRFDDARTPSRHGWPDLMDNQVQRMVECAEGHHDANGLVAGERQSVG